MEFTAAIYMLIALFCAVSAILYIFVPFWIKRMMDTLSEIKTLIATQNELLNPAKDCEIKQPTGVIQPGEQHKGELF